MASHKTLLSLVFLAATALLLGRVQAQPPPSKEFRNKTIPLKQHPEGQAMMAKAAKDAALVDINFRFLDKEYENDVWVGPEGARARVSCVRLKALSGFRMRIDVPKFQLTMQGLTIEQNIARLAADAIRVKFQLGPCFEHTLGMGIRMSNIRFVFKARPSLTFDGEGLCRLVFNRETERLRVAIGGLNITGLHNDLDRLAKNAVQEGVNFTLGGGYASLIEKSLKRVVVNVCGGGLEVHN